MYSHGNGVGGVMVPVEYTGLGGVMVWAGLWSRENNGADGSW